MICTEAELRDLEQRIVQAGARLKRPGEAGLYLVGALDAVRLVLCEPSTLERVLQSLERTQPPEPIALEIPQ